MKKESEFCLVIVKSLDIGYKIPDPTGQFAKTIKRCFDIMGAHHFDGFKEHLHPVYIEAKFNKTLSAFNLNRIEDHQAYYLSRFNDVSGAKCFVILGVYAGRGDLRAYVFNWEDLQPYYENGKSIYKKALEKLPYNKVHKGVFVFDKIIYKEDLEEVIL